MIIDFNFLPILFIILAIVIIAKTVKIVPQQEIWIVERLGKYNKNMDAGFNVLIPFVDKIAYKHSLKERAIDISAQSAITKDNVTLSLDGILYIKVLDPKQASYGVENPGYAVTQLAQTTMRSEIGKLTMDTTFSERDSLNVNIVESINEAAIAWGVQCMRYEIKDITPPNSVLLAMEKQVTAEREKRAEILESEAYRQAEINKAEGQKRQVVLASEAAMTDQINRATGEAEAIIAVAKANADGIEFVAKALREDKASDAASLKVAEKYIEAFSKLAKENNTILLPANTGDVSSMVAQAMSVIKELKTTTEKS
jgi:regulator of protease activity HflC (stomatin/prohibitin superfamily)